MNIHIYIHTYICVCKYTDTQITEPPTNATATSKAAPQPRPRAPAPPPSASHAPEHLPRPRAPATPPSASHGHAAARGPLDATSARCGIRHDKAAISTCSSRGLRHGLLLMRFLTHRIFYGNVYVPYLIDL